MEGQVPQWTETPPTAEGYYWMKFEKGWPACVVQVFDGKFRMFARCGDGTHGAAPEDGKSDHNGWYAIKPNITRLWYGPIKEPE